MGRTPKPSSLLRLEKGTLYDEQRDRAEFEPAPIQDVEPICPVGFDKKEASAWDFIASHLRNYALLSAANALYLEMAANAWVDRNEIITEIKKLGRTSRMSKYLKDYLDKTEMKLSRYFDAMGLSSTSLAKIGSFALKSKKQKTEMENLLD